MTVTVKHSKTNAISDWTQAQLDEQIALGNFAPGTTLADIVLPSDWNDDHTLTGLGTMAEQNANNVAITGGTATLSSVTTPSVTATTNNLTLSAISTGNINLNTPNGTALKVLPVGAVSSNWLQVGNPSATVIRLGPAGTTVADFRILAPTFTNFYTGSSADGLSDGSAQMRVSHTASAVNYVQVTGGATGTYPAILGTGSDGTVGLQLAGKGGGTIDFRNNGIGTATQFSVAFTASSVNYLNATGSGVSGNAPRLFALGTDTNISMAFQPKGTGAIDLAAGSSGVNISNGGTVTAITRTNPYTIAYTSIPSVVISAPTTAGGVQATATCQGVTIGATIVSGGTGYTVGNVLTVTGGTFVSAAAQITVTSVSAGVITGVTITNVGYTIAPSNPASVTGGTGSGATFNLTYQVGSTFTITNAGSGYIEQPTITFSGGGGSGAAAYATVGSGTIVRSLGSTMSFHTPAGEGFRVYEPSGTVANYWAAAGGIAGNTPFLFATGTDTNVTGRLTSKGTGSVTLLTNGGSQIQFNVAHTASAVNYVQATGGPTSGQPVLSVQGSDTNIGFKFRTKGVFNHEFQNGNSNNGFVINLTSGTVLANYIEVAPKITGTSPTISVLGTDTNIDLALTPKGTGLVRFGTYVAGALTATGYINIKAADGTTYKVLVST